MNFSDKTLSCRECKQDFLFTSGEQEFFALKNLQNEPTRCPNCRVKVKLERQGKDASSWTDIACHKCGVMTRVPFKPSGRKPVLCPTCFKNPVQEHPSEQSEGESSAEAPRGSLDD